MTARWSLLASTALMLLLGVVRAGPVRAEDGSGDSYWGPIPTREQAQPANFEDNDIAAWEWPFYVPYQVAALPFRGLALAAGGTVAFADESGLAAGVRDVLTLSFIPIEGSFGVSAGGSDGYGLSFSLTDPSVLNERTRLKLGLRYTTKKNSKATLGLVLNQGRADMFELGAGYRIKPNSRYYGTGPDTPEANRSFFTGEYGWFGASYHRRLPGRFSVELGGLYSLAHTRGPRDDESPTLEEIFDENGRPFGLGASSDGYEISLGVRHDNAGMRGRPDRGGLRLLEATWFSANDVSDLSTITYRAEAQQFVPLWFTRRALALRGLYSWVGSQGDAPVPFQRLMTNDDSDQFRGYEDQRWRDNGIFLLSAEYRWPVWNYKSVDGLGLDAYVFTDLGQVFDGYQQLALRSMSESYGGGFRFVITPQFLGRFEIGISEEDTVIRLSAEQVFQYAKNGLFHGKNPIPRR